MGEPPASGGCLRDWFTWICRYPRPPGGEGALAADLVSWAGSRGIAHTRDDAGNVLLGRGSGPILQAHLDMVDTDPGRGPLSWREQDGWICGQKRSLGADNGVGLALALDLLNREGPDSHWRALFTVGEEDGLKGARRVDPAWLNGSGLINLDAQEEGVLVDGSSGARDVHATLSFPQTAAHGNWPCWQLSLEGLPGGHSGLDIASPHRHPHAELARLLLVVPRVALVAAGPLGRRNALPREAWIRFRAPEAGIIPLKQVLASLDRTGGLDPRPALDPLAARQ